MFSGELKPYLYRHSITENLTLIGEENKDMGFISNGGGRVILKNINWTKSFVRSTIIYTSQILTNPDLRMTGV